MDTKYSASTETTLIIDKRTLTEIMRKAGLPIPEYIQEVELQWTQEFIHVKWSEVTSIPLTK